MLRFFVVLIIITILSCLVNYTILLNKEKIRVADSVEKIEAILVENFDQIEKILIFVGKKIAKDTPNLDLDIINKIFIQTASIHGSNNILSWSLFDWVNSDNYQTVNTMFGVKRKDPPNVSDRYYTLKGSDKWTLLFSKPIFGNPSKILVIPVGVQIETKNFQRAGTVVVGINIKKLVNIIESRLDKNIRFSLIDSRDDRMVFGSYDSEKYAGRIFRKFPDKVEGNNYIFMKELPQKYPYRIWVGYNERQFWIEVFNSSLLLSVQLIGTSVIILFLRKKL